MAVRAQVVSWGVLRDRGRRVLRAGWESLRERMASGWRWSAIVRMISAGTERSGGIHWFDIIVQMLGLSMLYMLELGVLKLLGVP